MKTHIYLTLVLAVLVGLSVPTGGAFAGENEDKIANASAKALLNNARAQAELYYDTNDESYRDVCKGLSSYSIRTLIEDAGRGTQGKSDCDSTDRAWAAEVRLRLGLGYYCVDSVGATVVASKSKGKTATACQGSPVSPSLEILSPKSETEWKAGKVVKFKWKSTGFSADVEPTLEIKSNDSGAYHKLIKIKKTGSYTLKLKGLDAGEYAAYFNFGSYTRPVLFTVLEDTSKVKIGVESYISSESLPGYQAYNLELSGGKKKNPVKWWGVRIACPSNITEAVVSLDGNICNGIEYVIGLRNYSETGESGFPIHFKKTDSQTAEVELDIRALSASMKELGKREHTLQVE